MNSQQMKLILENKGYQVEVTKFGCIVTDTKPISLNDLELDLGYEVPQFNFVRISSDEVFVPTEE